MFCPSCGNQVADGQMYCPVCGATLNQQASANPQPTQAPQPEYTQPTTPQYSEPIIPQVGPPVQQQQYTQPTQPQYNQPPFGQPYGQPQYNPQYNQPYMPPAPPKKKSKAPVIIVAIVAFLIVIGIIGSAVNKPSTNEQIEEWIDDSGRANSLSVDDSLYNFKIYARNDSLVYSYQYKTELMDEASTKQFLERSLVNYQATYENLHRYLKQDVKGAKSVIVEYLNKDGKVIASREYIS